MDDMLRVAVTLALLATVSGAIALTPATASQTLPVGTLDVRATMRTNSESIACPPDASPGSVDCRERKGAGTVPGLGTVAEEYVWSYGPGSPPCPSGLVKAFASTGRLVVAGKGEI